MARLARALPLLFALQWAAVLAARSRGAQPPRAPAKRRAVAALAAFGALSYAEAFVAPPPAVAGPLGVSGPPRVVGSSSELDLFRGIRRRLQRLRRRRRISLEDAQLQHLGPYLVPWQEQLQSVRMTAADGSHTEYSARDESGRRVTVRIVDASSPEMRSRIENEIWCLKHFGGGDIVALEASKWQSLPHGMLAAGIMLRRPRGTLSDLVLSGEAEDIPRRQKLILIMEILRALQKMSRKGWLHRDVNPKNIHIVGRCDGKGGCHAKLDGLGHAVELKRLRRRKDLASDGNKMYAAPEVWLQSGDLAKMDVWSVGRIAYDLFVGAPPVMGHLEIRGQRFMAPYTIDLDSDRGFRLLQERDPHVARFIAGMLVERPWRRLSVRRALKKASRLARQAGADPAQTGSDEPRAEDGLGE